MERWAHLSSQRQDPHLDLSYIGISSENIGGSPDLLVQAQQVQLAPLSQQTGSSSEEPSCPSTPSSPSSSIDSHSGFYSLVEDPSSPEAELNTAWMVSAQRQNQLATLKEERAFKLQTYSSSRRPRSLFPEQLGGQDAHQQEELKAGVEVLVQEEQRRLRQEIIRSQAPRKKTWTRDLDLDMGSRRLLNGLSLVYSKPEPLAPPAAGTVDKAQINFNAARQQFLRMELQDQQPNLLESLSPSKTRPRPSLGVASLEQQENRVQLDQDIAGRDQFDLHRKDSSWSQDLVAIKTTSLNAGPMSSRSTRDPETPIRQKIWLDQKCKEKLSSPHWLKSNDDTIQVQVTSSHLNSLSNPGPVHKEVQTGSKNQRRDSGILRLLSLEAPQKLKDGLDDRFSSPCCPHRHSEETELLLSQRTSAAPLSSSIQETKGIYQDRLTSPFSHVLRLSPPSSPGSWRGNLESNGLQSRGPGTSSFIQQEIEESLRREQELRELRLSRTQLKSFADPLVEQTTKEASRPAGIYPDLPKIYSR